MTLNYVNDIAAMFKCDKTRATHVFNRMGSNGLNLSECTKAQFKRSAIRALEELNQENMNRAMSK